MKIKKLLTVYIIIKGLRKNLDAFQNYWNYLNYYLVRKYSNSVCSKNKTSNYNY